MRLRLDYLQNDGSQLMATFWLNTYRDFAIPKKMDTMKYYLILASTIYWSISCVFVHQYNLWACNIDVHY